MLSCRKFGLLVALLQFTGRSGVTVCLPNEYRRPQSGSFTMHYDFVEAISQSTCVICHHGIGNLVVALPTDFVPSFRTISKENASAVLTRTVRQPCPGHSVFDNEQETICGSLCDVIKSWCRFGLPVALLQVPMFGVHTEYPFRRPKFVLVHFSIHTSQPSQLV